MADDITTSQQAELDRLGKLLAEHRVRGTRYVVTLLGTVLGIVGGIALIAFAIWAIANNRVIRGVFRAFVFGIVGIAFGIGCWQTNRRMKGLRVLVFADGLARIQHGQVQAVRWNDIKTVTRIVRTSGEIGKSGKAAVQLDVHTSDGRELQFDENLSDLKRLRAVVEEQTLDHLLIRTLEALRDGHSADFGEINVEPGGLRVGAARLEWARYGGGEAVRGRLTIRDTNQTVFCRFDTAKVPNTHVLLALAERFCQTPT
jgi:hypothetical protein